MIASNEGVKPGRFMLCCKQENPGKHGVALVAIGNSLRGDDGVASFLCATLPDEILEQCCFFDLGTYTSLLGECLGGHKAAIIVDSTRSGVPAGDVSIINLHAVLAEPSLLDAECSHGFSFTDELNFISTQQALPDRLLFFGIEAEASNWNEEMSEALKCKLPQMRERLSQLIKTVFAETTQHA